MTPDQVTIVRSHRRKKTIQTKYAEGHLWIILPAGMRPKDEQKWISRMIERHQHSEYKHTVKKSDAWLMARAQLFNKKYFNQTLDFSITYVTNQHSRFGSCTSTDRTIRISERVKTMPSWVQDYIIFHELSHLVYPDHSKKFWETVNQYKYAERAKGYLIALSTAGSVTGSESDDSDEID